MQKKLAIGSFMVVLVVLVAACKTYESQAAPTNSVQSLSANFDSTQTATPTNALTATSNPTLITFQETAAAIHTQEARNTATPIPSPTLASPDELPVSFQQPLPIELAPITSENIGELTLIGTIGEGGLLSTHYGHTSGIIAFVYSNGIDVYQRNQNVVTFSRHIDLDIVSNSDLFDRRIDDYAVSIDARYFAENRGDRVTVVDLATGELQSFELSVEDVGGWGFPVQELVFSADNQYLVIDATSEQVLIDLDSMQEVLRITAQYARSHFSEDLQHYILTDTYERRVVVYALPSLEEVARFSTVNYGYPEFALLTNDQRMIVVEREKISLLEFPSLKRIKVIRGVKTYSQATVSLTPDNQYLIIGNESYDKPGVAIFELDTLALTAAIDTRRAYGSSGKFMLSPDSRHMLVQDGDITRLVSVESGETLFMANQWFYNGLFTDSGRFFIAYNRYIDFIYDFETNQTIEALIGAEFLGYTEPYLWFYYRDEDFDGIHQYNLLTGETKTVGENFTYPSLSTYAGDLSICSYIDRAGMQVKYGIIDMDDFTFLRSQIGLKTWASQHYFRWTRDSEATWYDEKPINFDLLQAELQWNIDKSRFRDGLEYVYAEVSDNPFTGWKPYVRNITSEDGSYSGRIVASDGLISNQLDIYEEETGSLLHSIDTFGDIYNFKFSPATDMVFVSDTGKNPPDSKDWLLIYRLSDGSFIRKYEVDYYFNGIPMDISQDGKYLAMGNADGSMDVIDIENNWRVLYTVDEINSLSDIQFSSDGSYITILSFGDRILFYDTLSGEWLSELDVLGGYNLGTRIKMTQYYLMDTLIIATEIGGRGQVKIFGIPQP